MSTSEVNAASDQRQAIDDALALADTLAAEFVAGAAQRESEGGSLLPQLRRVEESGLLDFTVPVEHGGAGVPASTRVEILRRLARADSSVAQLLMSHFVVMQALSGLGHHPPGPTVFADVLAGARFGNAAAERGTRSVLDLRTTVTERADGTWVLDGKKYYATGALGAAWVAVVAVIAGRVGETAIVLVRSNQAGVELDLDTWSAFGQRGTSSGEVRFDNVVIESEMVLPQGPPPADPADAPADLVGTFAQAIHTAIDVGIARAALEEGAQFVTTRSRPWQEALMAGFSRADEDPHVVRQFGQLTAKLWAMEALLARGTSLLDEGFAQSPPSAQTAVAATLTVAAAKALAQEFAVGIASGVFELTGTSATDRAVNLDRHWRNVRTHSLHDPARWKYVAIGNHLLHGTPPPRLALFY